MAILQCMIINSGTQFAQSNLDIPVCFDNCALPVDETGNHKLPILAEKNRLELTSRGPLLQGHLYVLHGLLVTGPKRPRT